MIEIKNERLRTALRIAVPILILAVVVLGVTVLEQRRYVFVTLAVVVLALLLFAAGYERKKTGARRMAIVAAMTALSVVGRFIPLFKPVTALTVITGTWIGGEAGFLVGALSAVISNFYFGQGPWTPFQMLAWGLIGLFAGLLGKFLQKGRCAITIYGTVCGVVYSLIMDVWTVLWAGGTLSLDGYGAAIAAALPVTLVYCVSNAVFLLLLAKPFGEKLGRIKLKFDV